MGRRELDEKEQRRYNRMTQGAEIKHNEKEKSMYSHTFRKNMDRKNKDGKVTTALGPLEDGISVDDEYLEGIKDRYYQTPGKPMKVVPIRPDS